MVTAVIILLFLAVVNTSIQWYVETESRCPNTKVSVCRFFRCYEILKTEMVDLVTNNLLPTTRSVASDRKQFRNGYDLD